MEVGTCTLPNRFTLGVATMTSLLVRRYPLPFNKGMNIIRGLKELAFNKAKKRGLNLNRVCNFVCICWVIETSCFFELSCCEYEWVLKYNYEFQMLLFCFIANFVRSYKFSFDWCVQSLLLTFWNISFRSLIRFEHFPFTVLKYSTSSFLFSIF